jgi:nucleotide-binding universal stress UspA family protein
METSGQRPKIVVGVDGSPESNEAMHVGYEEARIRDGELVVVHAAISAVSDRRVMIAAWPGSSWLRVWSGSGPGRPGPCRSPRTVSRLASSAQ